MHARNTSEKIVEIQGLGSGGGGEKKTKALLCTRLLASSRVRTFLLLSGWAGIPTARGPSPKSPPSFQARRCRTCRSAQSCRGRAAGPSTGQTSRCDNGGPAPRYEGTRTSGTEPCRAAQGRCEFNYAPAADREAVVMAELEVAVLPRPVVHLPRRVQPEQEHLAGAVVERLLPPRVCRKAPKDLPPPSPQPPRPKP